MSSSPIDKELWFQIQLFDQRGGGWIFSFINYHEHDF